MNVRPSSRPLLLIVTMALLLSYDAHGVVDAQVPPVSQPAAASRLAPTTHPVLPGHPSLYWLLPEATATRSGAAAAGSVRARFARGVSLIADGKFTAALPLVSDKALARTELAAYGQYYTAMAQAGLKRYTQAYETLSALGAGKLEGYLKFAVPQQAADVALTGGNPQRAVELLEPLTHEALTSPETVWLKLAQAAELSGQTAKALDAYRVLYYEYPFSDQAPDGKSGIDRLETPALVAPNQYTLELNRAERLFAGRRWALARAGYQPLAGKAPAADDRELIALRLAECDQNLGRSRQAIEALQPMLTGSPRSEEARFFHLTATRDAGSAESYVALTHGFVAQFPDSRWSEEALNNLATYYIVKDEDEAADATFRDLARLFPRSRYAERAAWKIGWWAYKHGRFAEAAQTFEAAAASFPRADLRPAWLYWSGRSRDQAGDQTSANSRYRLASIDYLNSYYGRLSANILTSRREPPIPPSITAAAETMPAPLIPTDALVRQLVAAGAYTDALQELTYAQRTWGDTPALQATVAWIRHEQGLEQSARERFLNLRGAITLMKRAYPQYLAAGGENLPPEMLRIMFPVDYWPLIKKYSDQHGLDPYLMTALIAQESTFTADIKSAANAVGLMQLVPAAGRTYARKVGLRYSASLLTQPEANVKMGMAYFKDLSERFGGDYFALASYNAGPQRVSRWIAERPEVEEDEFIDDIPFPETQNYVKLILGTAEVYRRLYGGGLLDPTVRHAGFAATAPALAVAAPPQTGTTTPTRTTQASRASTR
jgi:soluble lytic murein transglycosylase